MGFRVTDFMDLFLGEYPKFHGFRVQGFEAEAQPQHPAPAAVVVAGTVAFAAAQT